MVTEPTLAELREAVRRLVDPGDPQPVRWRVVSIEYGGGIAPQCLTTEYTTSADLGGASHLTHVLPDGGRDETGIWDCCPAPHIEVWSDAMADYLVALLNADATRRGTDMPDLPRTTAAGRFCLARFAEATVHVYRDPAKPGSGIGRPVLDRLLKDGLVRLGEYEPMRGKPMELTELGRAVLEAEAVR